MQKQNRNLTAAPYAANPNLQNDPYLAAGMQNKSILSQSENSIPRNSHVEEQVSVFEAQIHRLQNVITRIGDRLHPVLSVEAAEQDSCRDKSQPRAILVPLADRIRNYNDSLTYSIDSLECLLLAVEL